MTITRENSITIINPSNGEILEKVNFTSDKEIIEKIQKAKSALPLWNTLSTEKRISYLKKIYDFIIQDREKIATTISKNNGKPLAESYLTEIASTLQIMEYHINNGIELLNEKNISLGVLYPGKKSFLVYEPYGVIGIIEPWNYPFYLPFSAITKALLGGNAFIFKPASAVSLVGKLIEEICIKAELPEGVANFIYGNGSVAEKLLESDLDKVIFTGSVEVGKQIAESCGKKLLPVSLELGGKDPAIVLKSCNLDFACGGILWGALSNCGQACASIERVYVQSEIYDEFVRKISSMAAQLKIGDPLDNETDIGPLMNEEQIKKINEHVSDALNKGAKIHCGGKKVSNNGFFYEPTVLSNVNHSMKVMTEETFGPVIPIMKFDSLEEVLYLANDTIYGLAASIWTGETESATRIASKLNCGTVWVNDSLFLQAHPKCPWQGYKDSGYGGSSIYDFVRTKHISIDQGYIPSLRPKSFWWYPYKGKARSFHDLIEVIFKASIKEKAKAVFQTMIDFLR